MQLVNRSDRSIFLFPFFFRIRVTSPYTRHSILHSFVHPSVSQTVNESVSQVVSEWVRQSMGLSVSQIVDESVSQSFSHAVSEQVNRGSTFPISFFFFRFRVASPYTRHSILHSFVHPSISTSLYSFSWPFSIVVSQVIKGDNDRPVMCITKAAKQDFLEGIYSFGLQEVN